MSLSTITPPSPGWPWTGEEGLRFDRFMDLALHDPQRGYYARRIRGVGAGGDFTTAPMISGLLARGIASWASKAMAQSSCRNLIEIGPGEGLLAHAVIKALPWHRRWRTRLHLVETSQPLRERQQALLGKRATWHRTVEEALDACDGHACLYSNELIDAFPVRRFRLEGWGTSELFLLPGEIPREDWRPASELPDSLQFAHPHPPGQILEVHESVSQWLGGWMPHWKQGSMLTIDYGAETGKLYHRRPRGTLRAYLRQERIEGHGVYLHPGRQDLTADVDFSDLIRWMSALASGTASMMSQREFLLPYAQPRDAASQHLIDPDGAGDAFQVMEFRRE